MMMTHSASLLRVCVRTAVLVALPMMMLAAGQAWGQTMKNDLIVRNAVPSASDAIYPDSLFTGAPAVIHGDATALADGTDGTVLGSANTTIVDWVVVELRFVAEGTSEPPTRLAGNNPDTVVRKTGLLRTDGQIVDANDPAGGLLSFEDVDFDDNAQDLYIVVVHRNHVPVMTAAPVSAADDGMIEYDFADAANKALGGNTNVQRDGTTYAVPEGDLNNSLVVDAVDAQSLETDVRAGETGYVVSDTNFTGIVDAVDFQRVESNVRAGTISDFRL